MNIRQQLKQSIKCGTGKAYFIVQDNPTIDFYKDITKAALTNFAHDPQVEGDRAHYAAQLINLSNKKEKIIECVLQTLATERQDTWVLDQLFELATIFAKNGDKKARQAIYKRYHKKVINGSKWCGQDAIVEIDGIEGLKFIAKIRGKALIKNPDDWEDSFFVDHFQKENPKIKVYEELEKASKNNSHIKNYLSTIKKHKWSTYRRQQRSKFNYKRVKENIEKMVVVPASPFGIRELTKSDIKRLANDFFQEKVPIKQEKYLRIFAHTKFPYDYSQILQIAKGQNSRNNRLVEYACKALSFFEANDIRQFAIKKISKTNTPSDYLPLLVSNYKKGDNKLLAKIADRFKDENIIHDLVWGYIDIYKSNKTKECKRPLEIIYDKLTCGLHRCDIIEILYENGVLSNRILKEIEFDSYDETRKLNKKYKKNSFQKRTKRR